MKTVATASADTDTHISLKSFRKVHDMVSLVFLKQDMDPQRKESGYFTWKILRVWVNPQDPRLFHDRKLS